MHTLVSVDPRQLAVPLAWVLGGYLVVVLAIGWWARGRVHDIDDYLVAGRRLGLPLASFTLLATWFGAGTLLTASDEVWAGGLSRAALDPLGAGVCLLIVGLAFAAPLWRMKLLTICDFFRVRFGPRAELLSACILVPSYFGWIATQFVAMAGILNLFFGLDPTVGILVTAGVGTAYTLLGGMWSVTVTDAFQMICVVIGVVLLGWTAFDVLGDGSVLTGAARLGAELDPGALTPVPLGGGVELATWLGVFAAGALGNIPVQDLMQRVFAARSEAVARRACMVAGAGYLVFGVIPLLAALAARILMPTETGPAVIVSLAIGLMRPWMVIVFIVAVVSAVLSTIDSAILSPAGVLAQNVLVRRVRRPGPLALNRMAVAVVAVASVVVAFVGESAYSLLEAAYELTMVGLLVPLSAGLFRPSGSERAAVASMLTGTGLWLVHLVAGWESFAPALFGAAMPVGIASTALAAAAWATVLMMERVGGAMAPEET